MREKQKTTLNEYYGEKLKTQADELKNYLDSNNSIIKSNPQLNARYNKIVDMYDNAVENKDYEMLIAVKYNFFEIFKICKSVSLFHKWSKKKYFIDKQAANELIEKGNNAIINNNIKELEDIIKKLFELMPPSPPEYECRLY